MEEDRRKVLGYSELTSKRILCEKLGCGDYEKTYGGITYYRHCLPRVFLRVLLVDLSSRSVPSPSSSSSVGARAHLTRESQLLLLLVNAGTWTSLIEAVPEGLSVAARYRCLQIVAEYASVVFRGRFVDFFLYVEDVEEMRAALMFYYESFPHRTCEWMEAAAAFDHRLFSQMAYRIATGCVSLQTGSYFKRALVYAHQVGRARNRVFLDDKRGHSTRVLWRLRRAFEHVMLGRFSVNNFPRVVGVLSSPDKIYPHSRFRFELGEDPEDIRSSSNRTLVVRGRNDAGEPDLVLTTTNTAAVAAAAAATTAGASNKVFPFHHYRGALELISSCSDDLDTVYLDRRLDHHYLATSREWTSGQFVFDSPSSLLLFKEPAETTVAAALAKRIADLSRTATTAQTPVPRTASSVGRMDCADRVFGAGKTYFGCQKQRLLRPSTDVDYEIDRVSVARHVQDFLLWIMSKTTTISSSSTPSAD